MRVPSKRTRKLLFLAYFFPPTNMSGCVRTWNIAKYLARLGWDIVVVTLQPSIWRYVEDVAGTDAKVKEEHIHRILTDHRSRWLSPQFLNCGNRNYGWLIGGIGRRVAAHLGIDKGVGWIKEAERACSSLSKGDIDVILATASPFSSFNLAKNLSDRLSCPYVLDYRDPWSGNPHKTMPQKVIREESRLLTGSAAVTIVSDCWAEELRAKFAVGSKLHVVTNGYDPEDLSCVKPKEFEHFAIVYTGNFYAPKRVISPVMEALKQIDRNSHGECNKWYFHYYGPHQEHVRAEANRCDLTHRVILHGNVPRYEALSAIKGAGVAVVITSVVKSSSSEDRGIVTGKIFEAIGLGIPILLVCPAGSDAATILRKTNLGAAFTGRDTDGMAAFLCKLMTGYSVRAGNVTDYSWPSIAASLDDILRGISEGTEKQRS